MKKKLLFVMNNLHCGGAEKALISLLETLDYSLYEVDLLLFKKEGIFLTKIPEEVNLLEEPYEYRYFDMSIKAAITDCLQKGKINIAMSRLQAGYIFRSEKNKARCEQRVWKYISKSLKPLAKEYDAAIGYLEKNPVYYCLEKVQAKKKIGFIHNDYDKLGMDPMIDRKYFNQLDHLVTVSEECVNILKERFPMYHQKIELMHNIVSPSVIVKLAEEDSFSKEKEITITSVGRLHSQKGFDLAVEACELLLKNGYELKWYVVGEGEERSKLEQLIHRKKLENSFILVGLKENPYPYIKHCDIYVQTSLYEGRCLTITEAKILQKPIVSTNFKVVTDQIQHGNNGLVVEMNGPAIYEGIKQLIDSKELRDYFSENLAKEDLGTESEVEKLYELCR